MTGLYWFAAGVGVPLLAWVLVAGDGGESADGSLVVRRLDSRLSFATFVFFAAFFGVGGLLFGWVSDLAAPVVALLAVLLGVLSAGAQSTIFRVAQRSGSSDIRDTDLVGRTGRVVLPIGDGRRGRVALQVGEQEMFFTAEADRADLLNGGLEIGEPVVAVQVENGIAVVARLDPELR